LVGLVSWLVGVRVIERPASQCGVVRVERRYSSDFTLHLFLESISSPLPGFL